MSVITPRQFKKFYMPSTASLPVDQQKWVTYDVSPVRAADSFGIGDLDNPAVRLCKLMAGRIQEWNFTDETGKVAEITWENVGEIPQDDITYLSTRELTALNGNSELSDAEKKS